MTDAFFGLNTPRKIKICIIILSVSVLLTLCGISNYFTANPFKVRYLFLWMLIVLAARDIIKLSRKHHDMK